MSGLKIYGAKPKRMYIGGLKAKKVYCRGERVWSAGSIVTYICNGVNYQEEIEDGNTVLSPTTFTPILDDATFLGWSLSPDDTTIQTSLVMSGEPITLYAVFQYANTTISPLVSNYSSEYTSPSGIICNLTNANINTSKYYKATVQFGSIDAYVDPNWSPNGSMGIYLNGGGGSTRIAYTYNKNGEQYDKYQTNNPSYTVIFTQTSGNTKLYISASSSESRVGLNLSNMGSITLYGKTIVG